MWQPAGIGVTNPCGRDRPGANSRSNGIARQNGAVNLTDESIEMAKLVILRWREDAVGFTGWDLHTRAELSKRLKRSVNGPPDFLRRIIRQVRARQLVEIEGVKEEEIASVRQILETMGAEVLAEPGAPRSTPA